MQPSNTITKGRSAKEGLLRGIQTLYDAVSPTLGARSRAVGIDYGFERKIIRDGVSVARVVMLKDPVENFGAQIVTEAARKTVDSVGDGTTLTTILAYSLIKESDKLILAGVKPMQLQEELERASKQIIETIKTYGTALETNEQKIQLASISASDKELGAIVADTVGKVGKHGFVTVEESTLSETEIDFQEGMQFDKGYANDYFITNPKTMEATFVDTLVLVTDKPLTPNIMLPFFKDVFETKQQPLVIFGASLTDPMRDFLVVNRLRNGFKVNFVITPPKILEDIAILTGARIISQQKGDKDIDVKFDDLGKADRITSYKDATQIVGGKGTKEMIDERIASLQTQLNEEQSDFEQDKLKERIAKLSGGVAVIKVGGKTEVEMKERKERADDAVRALKAALMDGIIPGGETVFLRAVQTLPEDGYGNIVMRNALVKPFTQLMRNAGFNAGMMQERIKDTMHTGYGIDVTTGQAVDMVWQGIIDPLAVAIEALTNAVSVAQKIIYTDVVITPSPEDMEKS